MIIGLSGTPQVSGKKIKCLKQVYERIEETYSTPLNYTCYN